MSARQSAAVDTKETKMNRSPLSERMSAPFARIVANKFSDGSTVYDVEIDVTFAGDKVLVIGAIDHDNALDLQKALNAVAWVDLQDGR